MKGLAGVREVSEAMWDVWVLAVVLEQHAEAVRDGRAPREMEQAWWERVRRLPEVARRGIRVVEKAAKRSARPPPRRPLPGLLRARWAR
jgi:hypothetical protein